MRGAGVARARFPLRESGHGIWADARNLAYAGPLFLALAGASFLTFGLHRSIWSYTSISDLSAIVKASTWAIVVFVVIGLAVDRMTQVPRGVWVNQWLILIVLLCGARLAYQFAKVHGQARAGGCLAPADDA